jgi:NADH-quinone oxidoreductase subunit C/WASH complex subunit FAM21
MVKTTLTICAAVAALIASSAYAQSDKAGEDKAAPSAPATKQEKQDAKAKRKATGKDVAAKDEGRVDSNGTAGTKKVSADEKAAAKKKRKAAGAEAAKTAPASAEGDTTKK